MKSYANTKIIKATAEACYNALTTNEGLQSWWTENIEINDNLVIMRYGENGITVMKQVEVTPFTSVELLVVSQNFLVEGTEKTDEWLGTKIIFKIKNNPDSSVTLDFAHEGLTPELACYGVCTDEWNIALERLKDYLEI